MQQVTQEQADELERLGYASPSEAMPKVTEIVDGVKIYHYAGREAVSSGPDAAELMEWLANKFEAVTFDLHRDGSWFVELPGAGFKGDSLIKTLFVACCWALKK